MCLKGISQLAKISVVSFCVLLGLVFIASPKIYIIETSITGIGKVIQNFFGMSTWMDPLRISGEGGAGFPQNWTIFYWAYWIAWFVATPFFIGKISEGRTIKNTIIGSLIYGALRVFLPSLYDTIRSNPDRFSGHTPDILNAGTKRSNTEFQFHDAWRNSLPEGLCENAQSLVKHLFPKTGNSIYGSDWLKQWRRALRVCHPDIFPIYFRLAVPQGNIHRSEITALLALAGSPIEFGQALIRTKAERRPDGLSKIWALLERLVDHIQDISDEHIPTVIQALFDVGDELLDPADKLYMFGLGNISHPVQHLLKRVPANQQIDILKETIMMSSENIL